MPSCPGNGSDSAILPRAFRRKSETFTAFEWNSAGRCGMVRLSTDARWSRPCHPSRASGPRCCRTTRRRASSSSRMSNSRSASAPTRRSGTRRSGCASRPSCWSCRRRRWARTTWPRWWTTTRSTATSSAWRPRRTSTCRRRWPRRVAAACLKPRDVAAVEVYVRKLDVYPGLPQRRHPGAPDAPRPVTGGMADGRRTPSWRGDRQDRRFMCTQHGDPHNIPAGLGSAGDCPSEPICIGSRHGDGSPPDPFDHRRRRPARAGRGVRAVSGPAASDRARPVGPLRRGAARPSARRWPNSPPRDACGVGRARGRSPGRHPPSWCPPFPAWRRAPASSR